MLLQMVSVANMYAQTLITGNSNSVNITEVVYERNNLDVIQTSSATSITNTNDSIFLKNATINDNGTVKNLKFFNDGGVISNVNFTANTTGVGVINNGVITSIENDGLASYTTALAGILNDTNINNYAFYDAVSNIPPSGMSDFDILFANAFRSTDYIAVTERNGNTFFDLTALDVNGNVIVDADILQFNSSTGSLNTSGSAGGYDWNTGFANTNYEDDQPQWMTIASAGLFNTSTEVYGFRIDNNGEADVKFFGISDTPFVPEPSSTALLGLGALTFLIRRKRHY